VVSAEVVREILREVGVVGLFSLFKVICGESEGLVRLFSGCCVRFIGPRRWEGRFTVSAIQVFGFVVCARDEVVVLVFLSILVPMTLLIVLATALCSGPTIVICGFYTTWTTFHGGCVCYLWVKPHRASALASVQFHLWATSV